MKVFDLVKETLEKWPVTRSSDRFLLWAVWGQLGYIRNGTLAKEDYFSKDFPSAESVTRARRKVQELHPELQATAGVKQAREEKQETKGTFIYREEV